MLTMNDLSVQSTPESTTIDFPRFGTFTFAPSDLFDFAWGLPGFPSLHRWLALTLDTQPNFVWLQSLDDLNVAIPTADPYAVFEDYAPRIPAYAIASLAIAAPTDFATLCVVIVSPNAEEISMNLFAPILLNLKNRRGRQIPLDGSSYSVRMPMPRKAGVGESAALQGG